MSSNNSTYVYENLAPGSIRLLELLPGQKDSTLECKIITARKGEHPKYEALSYACGDPTPLHLVKEQLSGTLLHIATNLHDALQRIRYENETRTLWVDAICIHQSNLDEKGHQVAHMGQIYRYASRVIPDRLCGRCREVDWTAKNHCNSDDVYEKSSISGTFRTALVRSSVFLFFSSQYFAQTCAKLVYVPTC
jgi:hypothetical protein